MFVSVQTEIQQCSFLDAIHINFNQICFMLVTIVFLLFRQNLKFKEVKAGLEQCKYSGTFITGKWPSSGYWQVAA